MSAFKRIGIKGGVKGMKGARRRFNLCMEFFNGKSDKKGFSALNQHIPLLNFTPFPQ